MSQNYRQHNSQQLSKVYVSPRSPKILTPPRLHRHRRPISRNLFLRRFRFFYLKLRRLRDGEEIIAMRDNLKQALDTLLT